MLKFASGAILALVVWQAPLYAQQGQEPGASSEATDVSVRLVEKFVEVSRLPDLYANLLKNLNMASHVDAELVQQKEVETSSSPISELPLLQALIPHLAVINAAGADLQTGFAENRTALILDAAELVKLALSEDQRQKFLALLKLSGVRKIFDVFYALVEPPANWSEQDSKTFAKFRVLADAMKAAGSNRSSVAAFEFDEPSLESIDVAKVILADALAVTHFADMRNSAALFLKDIALPRAELVAEKQSRDALEGITAFADMASGTHEELAESGSASLAGLLSLEQLEELHEFVKSDAMRKLSDQLQKIVNAIALISPDEADEVQAFMNDPKLLAALEMPPETAKLIEAQLSLLGVKWLFTLSESISPETRDKLLAAWISISMQASPR